MSVSGFDDRLARERRARLQAERLLAQRSQELYSANRKLAEHAHALSYKVIEQREENAALVGRSTKTQAALEVATEKADVAERRLFDSLTAVDDGFAIFDQDWRMVMANPAYLQAFDGVSDVAPGAGYESVLRIAVEEGLVDLQDEPPEAWIARMIERWAQPQIAPIELRLWNGTYIRLIDKRTPEGDIVSLALDITEAVRREQDLREARDAAEAGAKAKSAFLANMSHEIRTPMNGVVSMADLLRETELDEEQQLYADTIRNSGEALLVIINDILDYSKIDAGKLELHPQPFDLEAMIHEILRLLRPGLQGKDLTLDLDFDPALPSQMIGDPGRLRQILTNLIGNAIKFTEAGQVIVRVGSEPSTGADEGDLPLRIVVEDTGIGIPKDMQAHIFGEFNQVETAQTRRFDGTGLGLAITRKLVQLMGGSMYLDSEPGRGSAFGVALTLRQDPDAPQDTVPMDSDVVEGPDPPDEPASTANAGLNTPRAMRVLAAEDNKTNQLVFRTMLKSLDLDLTLVENGRLAVDAYKSDPPDVVFTDISMPEMDGITAAGEIRAHETANGLARVPMIAMTAHALAEDRDRILAAGIDDYLTKPLKKDDLIARLESSRPDSVRPLR